MLRSGSAQGNGISETCSEERALEAAGYLIPIYVQALARAQGRGSHSAGPFPTDRARGAPGAHPGPAGASGWSSAGWPGQPTCHLSLRHRWVFLLRDGLQFNRRLILHVRPLQRGQQR